MKQKLQQKTYNNLSSKQIQFLGLLQVPITSFEKCVEEELEENPTLEEEEELTDDSYENINSTYHSSKSKNHENFSIDNYETLSHYLTKQLIGLDLSKEALFLAKYLINSLDDNGYLSRDLYSISSDLLVSHNYTVNELTLKKTLSIIQKLEPCGVGAKNLQECLILQLEKYHKENKIAILIIREHYKKFSNKSFEYLMDNLNISKDELRAVYSIIENLEPFPSSGFSKSSSKSADYIFPDFITKVSNNSVRLQIEKPKIKKLRISQYYKDLITSTKDKETKLFLKEKIEGAKWFIDAIEKRFVTLKNVMETIITLQNKYFLSGEDEDLLPMKLADVASIVKMDISTISRVSNSKFIETHFGTFKVKELFSEAYRKDNGEVISTKFVLSQLKNIIESENKKRPLTDEELAEALGKEEYHIARRTVSKYRDKLNIETAKLRRKL